MDKTDLMKEYEIKIDSIVNWESYPMGYTRYIESELIKARAKAYAYDRIMSGEGCEYCKGLTIANEHSTEVFINHEDGCTLDVLSDNWRIQIDIKYCPKCGKPLTLPDGWEERMNQEETFDYNLEQLGLK